MNNTPAFPMPMTIHPATNEIYQWPDSGMTLRQWYAGQAIAGMSGALMSEDEIAIRALSIADALLKLEPLSPQL